MRIHGLIKHGSGVNIPLSSVQLSEKFCLFSLNYYGKIYFQTQPYLQWKSILYNRYPDIYYGQRSL